ncbi:MAG: cob(I)yrinic acid a,c-diamide adenosyltransferase [Candidatus Woesearchaeota archaeon]
MEKKRAPVYLWTGDGWGKTTSAFGVALRALGHGFKVVVVQFMKGRTEDIGEYKIQEKLESLTVKQFGREGWVDLHHPSDEDKKLAQDGLEYAHQAALQKPFLLILDEINLAAQIGLFEEKEVIGLLEGIPPEVHLYLTGRNAPAYLIERADFVNEIVMKKGPKKLEGEKGIDY